MAVAGSLTYKTELDTTGYTKGLNDIEGKTSSAFSQIRNIVASLGIADVISSIFGSISDSIDSAMNRIDTMDQFNRVITAMTGSAEEADKALADVQKTVKGTAYGLDVASKSTQKFVTSGMNLSDATKQVQTWADAVAFYGDGTNETFENVTDALSQMVAKGKVEMDQLNRLTDAGIPALQIYADSVGRSTAEVQEDLSNGVISAQEFMDGLSTAFNEGTNRFASITGAAKEAGASWGASFDNAKAAVTRGVQGIIESIDEMLTNNGLPTMREMIADFGSKAEEVLDGVSEAIKNIDFQSLINAVKTLAPLVIALTAAWVSYNAVMKAITIIQLISGFISMVSTIASLIPLVKSLKDAMILLNLALGVNPIVLIISAIAALVAGFIYLWNTSEKFRNFWIGLWEGIKSAVSSVIDWIKDNWQGLLLFLVNPIAGAFKLMYDNFDGFREFVDNFVESVKEFFQNLVDTIVNFFTVTVPEAISNFVNSVIEWFQQLPYMIGYFIGQIIGYFLLFIQNLVNFVTVDIPNFINGVIQWFASLPGKIWEFMQQVWQKIQELGANLVNFVTVDIPNFINSIGNWFAQLPGKIWTWLTNVISKIGEWLTNMYNKCKEGISDLVSDIGEWFSELPDKMKEIGKNIVNGVWKGIKGAAKKFKENVEDFFSGIVDGAKDALGIESPSKVFAQQVGQWIPKGVAVGIDDNVSSVMKSIKDMDDAMVSKMKQAVAIETGNVNAQAKLSSSVANNSIIQINAQFDGNVEMDKNKVGRIITPVVTKTIKVGGIR